jgi:protein-glutamine gamma-glutamyltransferase
MELNDSQPRIRIQSVLNLITYSVGVLIFVAICSHVEILHSVAFGALFLVSAWFDYKRRYYIPRWLLLALSLAIVAFSLYGLDLNELITQMLEALLLLLAVKFLEEKKFRDYMQIYAIALLLLSGLGLLSLSISFLVYFLLLIVLLTVSIVILTFYGQAPDLTFPGSTIEKILSKSLLIPLLAIPLSILMFVILPRSQYPLLDFLNRPDRARTGFSDNVRLGTVSDIQEDSSIVMRVTMDKIEEQDLYWRGITFDYFDGQSWQNKRRDNPASSRRTNLAGKSIRQTVYLEPYDNPYVFGLDRPVYISLRLTPRKDDFTYSLPKAVDKRLRYDVISIMSPSIPDDNPDRIRYLQLPPDMNPRIFDLARSLSNGKTPEEGTRAILDFLRNGAYSYSLKNLPITKTPLEDFIFKEKYGNCEYFASAFAVMLRSAGIPSRVVGGYKGGYYNEVGGYLLVPQKNAHVWVEAHLPGTGWLRMDPTPSSIEDYVSANAGGAFFRLRVFLDSINYYWNAMIINYNLEKQITLFYTLRSGIRRPSTLLNFDKKKGAYFLLGGLLLAALTYAAYKARSMRWSESRRILMAFRRRMEKYGYLRKPSQGLEEFVLLIGNEHLRASALAFVRAFEELYYRDRKITLGEARKLKELLRAVQPKDHAL